MKKPSCMLLVVMAAILGSYVLATGQESTIVYGHSVPITKLSPDRGTFLEYASAYEAAHLIYDCLVNVDPEMRPIPGLATSWEFLPDENAWLFHLRQGVTFHNGNPFTAEVACWNVRRWMDREIFPTDRGLRDPIIGCEVVNPATIKIYTDGVFARLPRALTFGGHAITDPQVYEEHGHEWYATHPVGTGPYRVQEFVVGKRLVLVANEQYWGGPPKVEKIVFEYLPDPNSRVQALRAGDVDVIDKVPPYLAAQLEADPKFRVESVSGSRVICLFLNLLKPPLNDVRVRKAIALAISRQEIANGIFMGYVKPADSHLAPSMPGYVSVGDITPDLDRARNLLTEAGWYDSDGDGVLDKEGKPLELTLLTPDGAFSMDVQVSEAVAASLAKVGFKINVFKTEVASYWPEIRKSPSNAKWDMALFGLLPAQGGSWHALDALYRPKLEDVTQDVPPVEWDICRYSNPEVSDLIEQAAAALDEDEFFEILERIQRILWEDMPSVPLYVDAFIAAAKAKIKGSLYWTNGFLVLNNVSVGE